MKAETFYKSKTARKLLEPRKRHRTDTLRVLIKSEPSWLFILNFYLLELLNVIKKKKKKSKQFSRHRARSSTFFCGTPWCDTVLAHREQLDGFMVSWKTYANILHRYYILCFITWSHLLLIIIFLKNVFYQTHDIRFISDH